MNFISTYGHLVACEHVCPGRKRKIDWRKQLEIICRYKLINECSYD